MIQMNMNGSARGANMLYDVRIESIEDKTNIVDILFMQRAMEEKEVIFIMKFIHSPFIQAWCRKCGLTINIVIEG